MVTGVTASPSDAIIGAGAAITLILALSEPVLVDESGGAPTLALNNGGVATYASGSGTSSLVFDYTVGAGQNVADLAVTAASLNSGTVSDQAGNPADLSGAAVNPIGTIDIEDIGVFNVTHNQSSQPVAELYTGPVADLQREYINITSDNLNVSAGNTQLVHPYREWR